MPNWCDTTAYFYGEKESVDKLSSFLDDATNLERTDEFHKSVSFDNWLGTIALLLGYRVDNFVFNKDTKEVEIVSEDDSEKWAKSPSCRGEYFGYDVTHNCRDVAGDSLLETNISSAWGPPEELLEIIADEFDLTLEFIAIEPGNELFYVYGQRLVITSNYYVDRSYDSREYETEEEVLNVFIEHLEYYPCLAPFVSSVRQLKNKDLFSKEFSKLVDIVNEYADEYDEEAYFNIHSFSFRTGFRTV